MENSDIDDLMSYDIDLDDFNELYTSRGPKTYTRYQSQSRATINDINQKIYNVLDSNDVDYNNLYFFVTTRNFNGVKKLLDAGINPNRIYKGIPLLHLCIYGSTEDYLRYVTDITDTFDAALFFATYKKNKKMAEEILNKMTDKEFINNTYKIIKLLLENGADPNIKYDSISLDSTRPNTALVAAIRYTVCDKDGDPWEDQHLDFIIAKLLLEYGADPDVTASCVYYGLTLEEKQEAREALINGQTLLQCIVRDGKMATLLLDYGADVNKTDRYGRTALHYALEVDDELYAVEYLLEYGANPNIQDIYGNTPLMLYIDCDGAFTSGKCRHNLETVKLLISYDADIYIKNNNGKTYLDILLDKDIETIAGRQGNFNNVIDFLKARIKAKQEAEQRLTAMASMFSREGPIGTVRYNPTIIEDISKYLSTIKQDPELQKLKVQKRLLSESKKDKKLTKKRKRK